MPKNLGFLFTFCFFFVILLVERGDDLNTNRNEFLAAIHFSVANTIEEYSKYLYEYKAPFFRQAFDAHVAIMEAFPELDFHTICRIKSFDSTLNKARSKTLEKVFDIHGMRFILHSVNGDTSEALLTSYCYKLKAYLEHYYSEQILPDRTKDYIASPKENGYQAIHLSGCDSTRRFEIQIKTVEMENVAKYGNANHAEKYKPRTLDKHPLTKVPHYAVIHNVDGNPIMHELNQAENFQYFYNRPYEDYKKQMQAEKSY